MPGGVGNQLFALVASRFFYEYSNHEIQPNFTTVDKHHTDIVYNLESEFLKDKPTNFTSSKFGDYLLPMYYPKNRISKKILKGFINQNKKVFDPNYDRVRDAKHFLDMLPRNRRLPIRVSGYFADFAFYDELETFNKKFSLSKYSQRYTEELTRISNSKTLGIHLRLGDFLENPQTIGVLSDDYYQASIEYFSTNYERIIVFTNDSLLANKRVENWKTKAQIEVISFDIKSNPLEDLLLLSNCSGIITSNSTFSFWAAKLSPTSQIVYPTPFRKDNFTEIANIPKKWQSQQSFWTEN
jgi:hypothetical protein